MIKNFEKVSKILIHKVVIITNITQIYKIKSDKKVIKNKLKTKVNKKIKTAFI
jgi:hypothetical protein